MKYMMKEKVKGNMKVKVEVGSEGRRHTWLERLYCGRLGEGLEWGGECGEGGRLGLSSPCLPPTSPVSLSPLLPSPDSPSPCRSSSLHAASLAMLSFTWWCQVSLNVLG